MKRFKLILIGGIFLGIIGGISIVRKPRIFIRNPISLSVTKKDYDYAISNVPDISQFVLEGNRALLNEIVELLENGIHQDNVNFIYISPTWRLELDFTDLSGRRQEVVINYETTKTINRYILYVDDMMFVVYQDDITRLLDLLEIELLR